MRTPLLLGLLLLAPLTHAASPAFGDGLLDVAIGTPAVLGGPPPVVSTPCRVSGAEVQVGHSVPGAITAACRAAFVLRTPIPPELAAQLRARGMAPRGVGVEGAHG